MQDPDGLLHNLRVSKSLYEVPELNKIRRRLDRERARREAGLAADFPATIPALKKVVRGINLPVLH